MRDRRLNQARRRCHAIDPVPASRASPRPRRPPLRASPGQIGGLAVRKPRVAARVRRADADDDSKKSSISSPWRRGRGMLWPRARLPRSRAAPRPSASARREGARRAAHEPEIHRGRDRAPLARRPPADRLARRLAGAPDRRSLPARHRASPAQGRRAERRRDVRAREEIRKVHPTVRARREHLPRRGRARRPLEAPWHRRLEGQIRAARRLARRLPQPPAGLRRLRRWSSATEDEASAYVPPGFTREEITGNERYSGFALSSDAG